MKIGKFVSKIACEVDELTPEDDNWLSMVLLAAGIAVGLVEIVDKPVENTAKLVKNLFLK